MCVLVRVMMMNSWRAVLSQREVGGKSKRTQDNGAAEGREQEFFVE